MTVALPLLDRLAALGVDAWRDGDRVRLRGREPSPELLAELRAQRSDVLAELSRRELGTIAKAPSIEPRGAWPLPAWAPVSWSDAAILPVPSSRCRCCGGGWWWYEAVAPGGWRCATCHPGDHLAATHRREVRT